MPPILAHRPSPSATGVKRKTALTKPRSLRPAQTLNTSEKQMDPVNGLMVDPATAPKTSYQGQTYYFSSEQSRKEFLENPAKFAKKPKR